MASWPTYRTVVLDERAQRFLDQNAAPGDRLDAQWQGLEWLICRKPEIGLPRHKHDPAKYLVVVVAQNDIAKTRELWVLYSYDDSVVTVHAVSFSDA